MKNNSSIKKKDDTKKTVLTNKTIEKQEKENKGIIEVKIEKEDDDIMLRVDNVTKYYNKRKVLDGITFKVKKGSIHGIIGSNGSGKSTTLKAIVKLIKIDGGEIFINKHQIVSGNKKTKSQSKFNVNFVPAEPYLPDTEVGEHIFDCAYLLNIPKEEVLKKFSDCEIFKFRYYYCQDLSSGWRKALQLFIATLNKSPLIILDEPMSGLDQRAREELIDYIILQKEKGKTIIVSTHLLSDLQHFSDEITIISEGKVLYTGPKTENIKNTYHDVGAQKKTSFEKLFS